MDLRIYGHHDERVIAQLRRCVEREDGARGVLCADGHLGYSAPIGGVVAYREHVSPAAVGYDIGCGNLAVRANLPADAEFRAALPGLMGRMFAGLGLEPRLAQPRGTEPLGNRSQPLG